MGKGRPPIHVKLSITSKDDDRFSNLRTFQSIPDASLATGLTDTGIRMAYNSSRVSMRKRLGEVYIFKWKEPDPIRVKPLQSRAQGPPRTVTKECVRCSKTLTPEDRSQYFLLDRLNDDESLTFVSIYHAS